MNLRYHKNYTHIWPKGFKENVLLTRIPFQREHFEVVLKGWTRRLSIVKMITFLSIQCQFCKKSTSTITNHTFTVLKGLKQSFHTCNPYKSFPMLAIYNNLGVKTLFIFIWIILLEWNFSYQYLKLNANNNLKYIRTIKWMAPKRGCLPTS